MADARFEDAARHGPLRLAATTAEDLVVISALVQDSVLTVGDIAWTPKRQRATLLINRFRWEEAHRRAAEPERVRTLLSISCALKFSTQGIDPKERDVVLSLLSLSFEPGEDGGGRLMLTFAGDGALAVDVEALEVTLLDVTRPHKAPSGRVPRHEDDT